MQPACAVSAPLTCGVNGDREAGWVEATEASGNRGRKAGYGEVHIQNGRGSSSNNSSTGSMPLAFQASRQAGMVCAVVLLPCLVKCQHLVHCGGGDDDLIKHRHRAANQPRVAALCGTCSQRLPSGPSCTRFRQCRHLLTAAACMAAAAAYVMAACLRHHR